MKQEKISSRLALRLGSILKRSAISLAIGPAMIKAMVLLAVQRLAKLINAAMLPSAPLAERMREVSFRMIQSMPPLYRIISSIPPASKVTMISSPIFVMPSPIEAFHPQMSNPPVSNPTIPERIIPTIRAIMTFTPQIAVIRTIR